MPRPMHTYALIENKAFLHRWFKNSLWRETSFAEKFLQLIEMWKEASGVWRWGCQVIPRFKNKDSLCLASEMNGRWQRAQELVNLEDKEWRDTPWLELGGVTWELSLSSLYSLCGETSCSQIFIIIRSHNLQRKVDLELAHSGFVNNLEKG